MIIIACNDGHIEFEDKLQKYFCQCSNVVKKNLVHRFQAYPYAQTGPSGNPLGGAKNHDLNLYPFSRTLFICRRGTWSRGSYYNLLKSRFMHNYYNLICVWISHAWELNHIKPDSSQIPVINIWLNIYRDLYFWSE